MLKAFKNQLKTLSETNKKEFQDIIADKVQEGDAEASVQSAKNLILTMPDLVSRIQTLFHNPRIPSEHKRFHGFLLSYLYHPKDFIPWTSHGLFGYLDDAYLTGIIFMKIIRNFDYYEIKDTSDDLQYFQDKVPLWLSDVRKIIPAEAKKIEEMVEEISQNKTDLFTEIFSLDSGPTPIK